MVGGVRVCTVCVPELSAMVEFSDGGVCAQPRNVSRRDALSYHHSNPTAKSQWSCYIVMIIAIVVLRRPSNNYYCYMSSLKRVINNPSY